MVLTLTSEQPCGPMTSGPGVCIFIRIQSSALHLDNVCTMGMKAGEKLHFQKITPMPRAKPREKPVLRVLRNEALCLSRALGTSALGLLLIFN